MSIVDSVSSSLSVTQAAPFASVKETSRVFYRFRTSLFLGQILFCILPAAVLLATGRGVLAGYYFWAALGMLLCRGFLRGRRDEILCLLIAAAPFINLLRGFAFYNIIIALLGSGLLHYAILAPGTILTTFKKAPLLLVLLFYVTTYYTLSLVHTRAYEVNLRLFELAFTITYVLILTRHPLLLGAALTGLIVSAWFVGLSMLPHVGGGARLGVIELDGRTLGNPTQLGIPLAFGVLALVVDRGRWLNLQSAPRLRWTMLLITIPLLALTTSRSAWLVAAGGILTCTLLGRRQRMTMIVVIGIAAIAIQCVLLSPYGLSLKKGIDRTFDENRNVRQRTSGRSDQWRVAWYALNRSAETKLFGYGAGLGPTIYAAYSSEVPGVKYATGKKVALHSLFMQLMVETGFTGLFLLLSWLAVVFSQILKRLSEAGSIFPLICLLSYLFIVITVSGNDVHSGIFLGLALLASGSRELNSPSHSQL